MLSIARNSWSGLRLALFLPVRRDDFRIDLGAALLAALASLLLIAVSSYLDQEFDVYVNIYGVLSLVAITFALFLFALAYVQIQGYLERFPDVLTIWAFSAPFIILVAIVTSVTGALADNSPIWSLFLIWAIIVLGRGAHLAISEASYASRAILRIGLVGFLIGLWSLGMAPTLFYSYDMESYNDYSSIDREHVYFQQAKLLETELAQIDDEVPGETDLYFVGFAGDGEESVFQSEAEFAATVVDQKYGTEGKSIVLANDADNLDVKPLANSYNLFETIREIGKKMNPSEDVLFLFLTSHGSSEAYVDVSLYPFELMPVAAGDLRNALDDSGVRWRIIVISACYSASFIDTLKDARTAIFTAAAADRMSFGCSSQRELTYFGEAFFRDSLPGDDSLEEAFEQALKIVTERETSEGRTPSNPTSSIGDLIRTKLEELYVPPSD